MKKKLTHFVRFLILPIAFLLLSNNAFSQGVGINNPVPDVSALLDLTSQTQGLLAPRMTSVQRIAIATLLKVYWYMTLT